MAAQALTCINTPVVDHQHDEIAAESALNRILAGQGLRVHVQPLVNLDDGAVIGYEALTRGPEGSVLESADALFGFARETGRASELEYQALVSSLNVLHLLPEGCYLTLNVGPQLFSSKLFMELVNLCSYAADQIVFELTEHVPFTDIKALQARMDLVQSMGYRVALDDTGCGFANFELASALRPAIVKLCSTTVAFLLANAQEHQHFKTLFSDLMADGMTILAEGIECAEDASQLKTLGVELGQGYGFGKPVPVDQIAQG